MCSLTLGTMEQQWNPAVRVGDVHGLGLIIVTVSSNICADINIQSVCNRIAFSFTCTCLSTDSVQAEVNTWQCCMTWQRNRFTALSGSAKRKNPALSQKHTHTHTYIRIHIHIHSDKHDGLRTTSTAHPRLCPVKAVSALRCAWLFEPFKDTKKTSVLSVKRIPKVCKFWKIIKKKHFVVDLLYFSASMTSIMYGAVHCPHDCAATKGD